MIRIGNRLFDCEKHTYVMGILNVTPDSFSDGGSYSDVPTAIERVRSMIEEGVDIVDVGGESTRPGFTPVPADEEIARVVPVIKAIKEEFDIPVSLDTYKAVAAEAGINAGADMINDIYGLKGDGDMLRVVSEARIPVCIVHNREKTAGNNFMEDVILDLHDSVRMAVDGGIRSDMIIIDPGIGFAKTYDQNVEILSKIDQMKSFNMPILIGISRKSFIGLTLNAKVDERMSGTIACSAWSVMHGAGFLRVHDVREHVDMVRMLETLDGARNKACQKKDHEAYVAYGSNLGNRVRYIEKALTLLNADPHITITDRSSTIETAPYGGVIQKDFLNGVVKIKTTYTPEELLIRIQNIENDCERVRTMHWGPRTLDLDILLYDDIVIRTDQITIPHPDMQNRTFVLEPLCEIAPKAYHPVLKKTAAQMLDDLKKR